MICGLHFYATFLIHVCSGLALPTMHLPGRKKGKSPESTAMAARAGPCKTGLGMAPYLTAMPGGASRGQKEAEVGW